MTTKWAGPAGTGPFGLKRTVANATRLVNKHKQQRSRPFFPRLRQDNLHITPAAAMNVSISGSFFPGRYLLRTSGTQMLRDLF